MKTQKIKTQLMKQMITYILILFVVISMMTSYVLYQSSRGNYVRQNRRFLTVMHQQVNHFLMHPEKELRIVEHSISKIDDLKNSHNEINFILERFNYIDRVEYLSSQGEVLHTFPIDDDIINMDYSRNPVYLDAKKNDSLTIHYGSIFIDPVTEKVSMPITLKTRDNRYLVGYLNLKSLKNSFETIDFKNSIYAILDEKGNYILHPDEHYVKERRANKIFNEIRTGEISTGEMITHNNELSILQYQRIESTGWTLLLYQGVNDIVQPVYMTLLIFVVTLIIILFVMIISSNYNLKKVDHVLLDFIDVTKRVSQGEYETEVPNFPYSEFQILSNNFNNMIEEVEIREEEILKLNEKLEDNYLNTVFLLARTIEAKDTYTGDHCDRVRYYALIIGEQINLSVDDINQLKNGSLLHDIGKLGVPESILTKPGRLTTEEYALIKEHCRFGYELIKDLPKMKKVKDIVLYHHEHYDGNGYPKGLKGQDIPLLARIVCIADAYDAMTSERVYKSKPMTMKESIEELKRCSNKQFDQVLVEAFIEGLFDKYNSNSKQ